MLTWDSIEAMFRVIESYDHREEDGDNLSWQYHAGLSGVGDIRLMQKDPETLLTYVNSREFASSEDGAFLLYAVGRDDS